MNEYKKILRIREMLFTYSIIASYLIFIFTGIVIGKYNPTIIKYVDLLTMPLSLCSIVFIYCLYVLYEQKRIIDIDKRTLNIVRLYSEEKPMGEIADLLNININDVRRAIIKFCKIRSE